jgi:hypothetical protein
MTKALMVKLGALTGGGAVIVAGALYLVLGGGGGAGPAVAPRSWIDDPLHGTHTSPGSIAVLAHAADPDGVAALELTVNAAVVATTAVTPATPLAQTVMTWTATTPGTAFLRVRARDTTGAWGAAAQVTIVVDGPGPTPTVGPTATPPPTTSAPTTRPPTTTRPNPTRPPRTSRPPSPTRSPAPCTSLIAPRLVSPAHNAVVGARTPTLRWSYDGRCPPGGFTVQVSTERDFSSVERTGSVGGGARAWSVTPALTDCRTYYWRVRATIGRTVGAWSGTFGFIVREGRCP